MAENDMRIGPRMESVTYDGKMTGIDYLTGIEFPVDKLVLVTADKPDFNIDQARYIARFCYEYGVGNTKKPPVLVEESSLEVVEKARKENVTVEIRDYEN